ncbi:MAG: putative PurR-regulated permease PerM [Halieaceae bacterium]|jgi:predicted PurR-regulated permease PerM
MSKEHGQGLPGEPSPTEPDALGIAANRWPLIVAVVLVATLLFYLLQPILLPFVLGALVGYLGDPLVDRIEARGGSRTLGVVLVFMFFSGVSLLGLVFAVPLLLQQLDGLVGRVPLAYVWLRDVALPWLESRTLISGANLPQVDWSAELRDNWQSLGKMTALTVTKVTGSGIGILVGLANVALIPVVAFYLMRDWDLIAARLLRLLPHDWQGRTAQLAAEADEVVGAFLRGQFIVMCALGVLYSAGLWVVGVQLALLLGLIAGLASIVPYLGFIVGISTSLIAAYLQFHDWLPLLSVGLVFGVGQLVESMVLTPVLVGDRIGLHPVAVIFALMAGAQLAGFVGIVVALPVAAVIMVFARHAVEHYRSSDLYGRDETLGDD